MADPTKPTLQELLARAQSGDNEAVGQLYLLYSKDVHRVIRRKLHSSLRRRYDSSDFVQSVWKSFVELPQSDFCFDSPQKFIAFLAKMAYNKVISKTRQQMGADKRDLRRELSLDAPVSRSEPERATLADRLPSVEHTPSQFVIAKERWAKIIRGQPIGHVRVLELLRDGYSHTEIMGKLGVTTKVIRSLLHRLEHFME